MDQYPAVVPIWYEKKHRELGKKAESVYERYHAGSDRSVEEILRELSEVLRQREQLEREIDGYVRRLLKDGFAARKEVVLWLRNFGGDKAELTLNWIKEDGGRITWRTAHRIAEPGFMEVVAAKLAVPLRRESTGRLAVAKR